MTEIGADGCGCCTARLLGRSCICHDKAEARDQGLCPSVYCPLPLPYPQPELPQSPLPTQTHAPGRLLSRAGTRAPFPPWRTITLAVGFALREWCQPRGLACNSPLLQAGAWRTHTHTHVLNAFSQHRSTRWMATRDARRSKSPPAAGRYSPAAAAAAAIGDLLTVVASLLKQSKLFFFF